MRFLSVWLVAIILCGCSETTPPAPPPTYEDHRKSLEETTAEIDKDERETDSDLKATTMNREARRDRERQRRQNERADPDWIRAQKDVKLPRHSREELRVWLSDLDKIREEAKHEHWDGSYYYQERLEDHARALLGEEDAGGYEPEPDREEP